MVVMMVATASVATGVAAYVGAAVEGGGRAALPERATMVDAEEVNRVVHEEEESLVGVEKARGALGTVAVVAKAPVETRAAPTRPGPQLVDL